MKSYLITLLIPFISLAQNPNKNQFVISGKIKGDSTNNINIVSEKNEESELIPVSEQGLFNDTLFLKDGEYVFAYGQSIFSFSIERDLNVHLSFDHKDLWSSANFSGKDAGIMNYYFEQFLLEMELLDIMYQENLYQLDESEFVQTVDSITNLKKAVIYRYDSNLPDDFKKFELGNLKYYRLLTLDNYDDGRRWIRDEPSFTVSDKYPAIFSNISFDEEYLYTSGNYISYIKNYLYEEVSKHKKENPEIQYEIYLLEITKKKVSDPELLNILFTNYLNQEGKTTKNIESFFELLRTGINDSITLIKLDEIKEQRKKTAKGAEVANFKLHNEKGELVELNDFEGNLIVIDVWASWCLPCRKEMPIFEEMKIRFVNEPVVFIGINAMDSKENWMKTLEEESLTGVQLFAPKKDITFFEDLMIYEMPRYILIDKNGKLLESRLIRPSHEKFYDKIKESLN